MRAMLPAPALVPNAVAFWNARRGVLATGRVACLPHCAGGTISLTTDGGQTFRVVLRTRVAAAYLRMIDGTAYAELQGGGVYASRDGVHWHGSAWPAEPRPTQCARSQTTYTTSAGGRRWALCGGVPSAGNVDKELYVMRNGGRSWRLLLRVPGGRPHGMSTYGYPLGISFAADGFGLIWESRGTLYVTRDGGRTWTAQPKVARPEIDFGRGATALPGGRGFVLLGFQGTPRARLVRTGDDGRSWHVVHRWR
jgi:photosystem II stability/assembly factor-like uncharacterized protein